MKQIRNEVGSDFAQPKAESLSSYSQGNAWGLVCMYSSRPVRAKVRVWCYALTGRKSVGYGSFPGRCPGL
ncbi:hypothetical protein [Bacteroides stercorirosoris]|uniref:hypothetical protein n=1 Tax=Bacteroides stercorirosoris TaxID=871324 RepID=UPI0011C169F7|nr:hypothetical protein [Bacteroides stercorirosoris]